MEIQSSASLPSYQDLSWRLDIKTASRSIRGQMTPVFVLMFVLDKPDGTTETRVVEADPNTIGHLAQTLELALRESSSAHSRRVTRNIH
ncbi:hypothetical protein H696_03558 [Fonticula alba]|uniref:COMM domain-containing protein n=1 Tax=Fonticula alba TaxID=691883 RepID=A0A058Z7L4_FONAL|nr:hypothetical protein H696_03558 [Fonticula alba]KCV70096.1 hypothetical protein H696_03558 [Fonticula alba]|eukprot:XP_009495702.1 hypothetical protein H696_03558 [Fonticula alba]